MELKVIIGFDATAARILENLTNAVIAIADGKALMHVDAEEKHDLDNKGLLDLVRPVVEDKPITEAPKEEKPKKEAKAEPTKETEPETTLTGEELRSLFAAAKRRGKLAEAKAILKEVAGVDFVMDADKKFYNEIAKRVEAL